MNKLTDDQKARSLEYYWDEKEQKYTRKRQKAFSLTGLEEKEIYEFTLGEHLDHYNNIEDIE